MYSIYFRIKAPGIKKGKKWKKNGNQKKRRDEER